MLLAPDVGEIEISVGAVGEHLRVVEVVGRDAHAAFEYLHCLAQGVDAVDQGPAGESCLAGVLAGHDHAVDLRLHVGGNGERTGDRTQTGVEREFSQQHEVAQSGGFDLTGGHEDSHGDRQVEGGSDLADSCRGEVHGDAPGRGHSKPALRIAAMTRSRLSRTALSGRPTTQKVGRWRSVSTSTWTR